MLLPPLPEMLEAATTAMRSTKTEATLKGPADLATMIEVWRDGSPIAMIQLNSGGREIMLDVAHCCIGGFAADALVLSFETLLTVGPINEATGQEWEPEDLEEAIRAPAGQTAPNTHEVLVSMVMDRDLNCMVAHQRYRYAGSALFPNAQRALVWEETIRQDSREKPVQGAIPEWLAAAFLTHPTYPEMMHREFAYGLSQGLTEEFMKAGFDLAVIRLLRERWDLDIAMWVTTETPERLEVLGQIGIMVRPRPARRAP